MAVSSAVSGTAEQTGDSSVRIRDEEPPGNFSETKVGDGDGLRPGFSPHPLEESETCVVSLILINTNKLNWMLIYETNLMKINNLCNLII